MAGNVLGRGYRLEVQATRLILGRQVGTETMAGRRWGVEVGLGGGSWHQKMKENKARPWLLAAVYSIGQPCFPF